MGFNTPRQQAKRDLSIIADRIVRADMKLKELEDVYQPSHPEIAEGFGITRDLLTQALTVIEITEKKI